MLHGSSQTDFTVKVANSITVHSVQNMGNKHNGLNFFEPCSIACLELSYYLYCF